MLCFYSSDFQIQVLKECAEDDELHLYFDKSFNVCPKEYIEMITIGVYHKKKNQIINVVHSLTYN